MAEHDATTGQFTAAEPVYGREAAERDAGFVPMPDESKKKEAETFETPREAAEALAAELPSESEITSLTLLDDDGNSVPENESVTLEQAAKLLSDSHRRQDEMRHGDAADAIRAAVDELRGVKPDEAEPATEKTASDTKTAAEPAKDDGELPDDFEKALPPKVREAVAAQIAETETARLNHLTQTNAAVQIAQATFMSQFPEFAHIPPENMGAAVQAMIQQDPARAAQIASAIERTAGLFEQQRVANQQEAQARQTKFQEYAKAEDARFEQLVKGESKDTMRAVPALIKEALVEYGADLEAFGRLAQSSDFLRSAAAQRLLVDAAKYRQIMGAKTTAAPKSLPPVQRPGVSQPRVSGNAATVSALKARFEQTGNLKDAAAYRAAKQRAG